MNLTEFKEKILNNLYKFPIYKIDESLKFLNKCQEKNIKMSNKCKYCAKTQYFFYKKKEIQFFSGIYK